MTELICGDCLEVMQQYPPRSVDMILCDLPYGTTRNKWDNKLPLGELFAQYDRLVKDNGAVLLFAQPPFSADLINGWRKNFRYEWVWEKSVATGFLNSHKMPLKAHESILVFYKRLPVYNAQFGKGKPYSAKRIPRQKNTYGSMSGCYSVLDGNRYPKDVVRFGVENGAHPTQKPVPLLEYLIKTYTNEGDVVMDNCMGSGSTGVACVNTGRRFIGIEKDEGFFQIAKSRIQGANKELE